MNGPLLESFDDADLRSRTVRSAAISLGAKFGYQAISMIFAMVLARLLSPSDFGLMTMASSIAMFFWLLSRSGFAQATVQKRDLTSSHVTSLFWLGVGWASVLTIVVVAISPLVSRFYRNPQVGWLTFLLAGVCLIEALSSQPIALAMRRMRFGRLASVQLVSVAVGGGLAVILAMQHWGSFALAARLWVTPAVVLVGMWGACSWRPTLPDKGTEIRGMLRFGGYLTGCSLVGYVSFHLDRILIGWSLGPTAAGLYERAFTLMMLCFVLFVEPLESVMLSFLSRIHQDKDALQKVFGQCLGLVILGNSSLALGLGVCAAEILPILYGSQWEGSVSILRWLSIVALLMPILSCMRWLYLATGRTDRLFRWHLVSTPLVSLSFLIGLRWGASGVAASFAVAACLLLLPGVWWAARCTGLASGPLFRVMGRGLLCPLVVGGLAVALDPLIQDVCPSLWGRLLIKAFGGGVLYLALAFLCCREEVMSLSNVLRRWKKV